MKNSIRFIAMIALVLAGLANAQIYKSVDVNGVVTFSDTPPKDPQTKVEQIKTPPAVNAMQATPVTPADSEERDGSEVGIDRVVGIVSPMHNATIPMGAGIFDVAVDATPELGDGESLELYLDGEKVGEAQTELSWTLTYVIRGAHTLEAKWVAENGSILATSEPITVFVLRPSIL
ncbi:hypothetical protein OMB55_00024210 [gamma proteobacterium HIMB55]|nr:hypothetical protein OMB55_00024210 [gamma proteobacterium HIMB55]